MPKVSVLVPLYRTKESYLRAMIESILTQTFSDFELLLLDDCPEESREAVVRSYDDARIAYAKNARNLGITPSRNRLIEMARGEYLAICDHDDVSVPTRFEKEVAYLDAHPEVGVVSGWMHELGGTETTVHPESDDEIRYRLMDGCYISHPAAMVRKSVLTANGVRYEEYYSPAEDYALWCRLIPYTRFHNLQEVMLEYRLHETNTSKTQRGKMHLGDLRVRALNRSHNAVLWNEAMLRAETGWDMRLLGVPFLSTRTLDRKTRVRLFGLPLAKIRSWCRMGR